jgi:redox-sensitive bicupin YhaK (pirin superfamily)
MKTTTMQSKTVLGLYRPASTHMVGDGFHVRNLFPSNDLGERISPFLLLDYMGPTTYGPTDTPRGVGEHPHRGFETVTIVYQGELEHRDSAGNSGKLSPGDVQWMTAASGIVHEEKHERNFAARGGTLQGVQLWVNLPKRSKMSPPRYQEIAASRIPTVELPHGAGSVRVIAGEFQGIRGPAQTVTPLDVWDVRLSGTNPGSSATASTPTGSGISRFEIREGHIAAAVVLEGEASVEGSHALGDAEMALLSLDGTTVTIVASKPTKMLFLSGVPLGEPVVSSGPFVMNTGPEIYQAIQDYQSGRMGHLS